GPIRSLSDIASDGEIAFTMPVGAEITNGHYDGLALTLADEAQADVRRKLQAALTPRDPNGRRMQVTSAKRRATPQSALPVFASRKEQFDALTTQLFARIAE